MHSYNVTLIKLHFNNFKTDIPLFPTLYDVNVSIMILMKSRISIILICIIFFSDFNIMTDLIKKCVQIFDGTGMRKERDECCNP